MMSKILIIGNGPSILENKYGKIIDSDKWDVVMRFNRWEKDDDGKEWVDKNEYVGKRCDYWMINDLRINLGIERRKQFTHVLIVCPKFKFNYRLFTQIENKYDNIKFLSSKYEDTINEKFINFSPQWPSTGVMGVYFGVLHFKEVYLHGFDTYDYKVDKLHYFEDKPIPPRLKNNGEHEPNKEKKFLKIMKEKYNVKSLEEIL